MKRFEAVPSPYLVPFDGSFRLKKAPTAPSAKQADKKKNRKRLARRVEELADLQRMLYAHDSFSVLLVFQAMDAAGKDSTIRAVLSGVDPAGFQVASFKQPSSEELDHDFLWRIVRRLPERGRIGVFNRSYYEEVLVVRVHPEYLDAQSLPYDPPWKELWKERHASICDFELHLARNGVVVVKFFLNVSREEQRRRFVARIDTPEKNWKFSAGDVREAERWSDYMAAYQDALRATSRPWAPWYAVPADDKPYMRATVADLVVATLRSLPLAYPSISDEERQALLAHREKLVEPDQENRPREEK
jgi:PPK2 family polyphosphate:nucleotide phosphotransferase